MAIPEKQLTTWSNQGAMKASADTHKSIRIALEKHSWPPGMKYEAYLQGSYPNATNIRGNSDVDLVVETDSVFYSNLTEDEKAKLSLTKGKFSWSDFRAEVLKALQDYYESKIVDDSPDKCIRILPTENRLSADVIPCVEYRRYKDLNVIGTGMTFWTKKANTQIINYPKTHLKNGATKNQNVSQWYKPSVRMLKNARERFEGNGNGGEKYPSYFLECLFYNVPNSCYGKSYSETYMSVANHLIEKRDSNSLSEFVTQSGLQWLFGDGIHQWNEPDARAFIDDLVELWNQW